MRAAVPIAAALQLPATGKHALLFLLHSLLPHPKPFSPSGSVLKERKGKKKEHSE